PHADRPALLCGTVISPSINSQSSNSRAEKLSPLPDGRGSETYGKLDSWNVGNNVQVESCWNRLPRTRPPPSTWPVSEPPAAPAARVKVSSPLPKAVRTCQTCPAANGDRVKASPPLPPA